MKIYIDHFSSENRIALDLITRIKSLNKEVSISTYRDNSFSLSEEGEATKLVTKLIDQSDIVIPIITSAYLSNNAKEISDKLIELSANQNKYLLPLIYNQSNWSSIKWIVKSKVFPHDGHPLAELTENEQSIVLNDLTRTIEDILVKKQRESKKIGLKKTSNRSAKDKVVFISHDHDDADFAELLKLHLEKHKINGWIDSERLKIGQDWREEIDEGITNSIAVIAIMTPEARKSEYVTYEWAFAWGKGKNIFPIMLKQTPLHPRLESLQYLDFTNRGTRPWDKLVDSIEDLLK